MSAGLGLGGELSESSKGPVQIVSSPSGCDNPSFFIIYFYAALPFVRAREPMHKLFTFFKDSAELPYTIESEGNARALEESDRKCTYTCECACG